MPSEKYSHAEIKQAIRLASSQKLEELLDRIVLGTDKRTRKYIGCTA